MIYGVQYWIFWLVVAAIFAVAEAMTVALVSIWFLVAALVTAGAAALGLSFVSQIICFAIVSLVSFLVFFRYKDRLIFGRKSTVATNYDRIIGAEAEVIESIDNVQRRGLVCVRGERWSALSRFDQYIPSGEKVRVVEIAGVRAIVEPINEVEA
ncbi:MAG: NfeD family protein [Eubacteriales bacterium]|nr:NfeD family protein [Eubacteriales bacterium]